MLPEMGFDFGNLSFGAEPPTIPDRIAAAARRSIDAEAIAGSGILGTSSAEGGVTAKLNVGGSSGGGFPWMLALGAVGVAGAGWWFLKRRKSGGAMGSYRSRRRRRRARRA